MLRTVACLLIAVCVMSLTPSTSFAFPQFMKVFVAEYLEENEDEDFVKMVKKEAKCVVCHQGKKKKKNMNAYGAELSKLLDKGDKKDVEKITEALQTVAEIQTDAEDEESPTYGDRISDSKLPAGELEDLLEEPSDSE